MLYSYLMEEVMDFIDYYKINRKDINKLEMILQSYDNLVMFSTMDSKVAIIRIMSNINNKKIITDILDDLDIELKKLESYGEE